jgi:ribosomal-protein-alanine N-acetyltransferase
MVTLEPRTAAHAEALYALLADPAVCEFLDDEPPVSVEVLRVRLARSETRRSPDGKEHWLNWIVRDGAGRMAGYVQGTVAENLETNVAYVMGTAFRGRGLATAAVAQMLRILVADFGVTRFFIVADRRNRPSIRLAERLGFAAASPELTRRKGVEATDLLMQRVEA